LGAVDGREKFFSAGGTTTLGSFLGGEFYMLGLPYAMTYDGLVIAMEKFLTPIRERRAELAARVGAIAMHHRRSRGPASGLTTARPACTVA